MNHLGLALMETHTWIDDKLVNRDTIYTVMSQTGVGSVKNRPVAAVKP